MFDSFLTFAVLHEVGHALIHQFRLPVLGGREDAADGFATYALVSQRDEWTALGAAWWFVWLQTDLHTDTTGSTTLDYGDAHLLPGQRNAHIMCLVAGFHRDSTGPDGPRCIQEWVQLADSWKRVLRQVKPE